MDADLANGIREPSLRVMQAYKEIMRASVYAVKGMTREDTALVVYLYASSIANGIAANMPEVALKAALIGGSNIIAENMMHALFDLAKRADGGDIQ